MHVDESRADMRTGASAYLGLARVLLEEPVTKQAKRLFLAAVVAVVLLLARGLGRRRRRAVLGRGRVRRGLLLDILGAMRQHRDAAPRLLARRYRRFCLLGLRLVAGHRQEGQPLGLPQNALASPPKRQILKIALKSGLGLMLFGMTKAI